MGEVVDLASRRPHLEGETVCLACGDRSVGVAPLGVAWMDCGVCGASKKIFSNPVANDVPVWHCVSCSGVFFLIESGNIARCAVCGKKHSDFGEGP